MLSSTSIFFFIDNDNIITIYKLFLQDTLSILSYLFPQYFITYKSLHFVICQLITLFIFFLQISFRLEFVGYKLVYYLINMYIKKNFCYTLGFLDLQIFSNTLCSDTYLNLC